MDYDAIVIGSGVGGLASAALLAKAAGWRVLVLERRWRVGGFTHAFRRGAFEWDVGLHYVGDLQEGGGTRRVFDAIAEGLEWARLPAPFDRFAYPDLTVDVPDDPAALLTDLQARFPAEREGLERFFRLRQRAAHELGALIAAKQLRRRPERARLPEARFALKTTAEVTARCIRDPRLAAALLSQWGDYGVPPRESAFGAHAAVSAHYDHGGWYPVGGGGAIADAIVPAIEAAGGAVWASARASEILLEGGRAAGVRVLRGRGRRAREVVVTAPRVLSNAGAMVTFGELLPREAVPEGVLADLRALPPPPTVVTLYLGLAKPPSAFGLSGGNVWVFQDHDHDAPIDPLGGRPGVCYLSFPSARNPAVKASATPGHTAEIIMPAPGVFAPWEGTRWRRRGEGYEALKAKLAEVMLDAVEPHAPGLGDAVVHRELSTPLTIRELMGHDRGAIYGLPAVPARFRLPWLRARTPVPGVFLTGSDVGLHGIGGALMDGVVAAGMALGRFGPLRELLGALPFG